MTINAIKQIYSSPDLKGEGFLTPVKRYRGFFIDQIKDSHPLYKGAMVIAHIATGILAYPLLALPTAVGMAMKTISYIKACYTEAQDTLKVWEQLGQAIGRRVELDNPGFFKTFKLAREFPHWVSNNKAQLDKVETLNLSYTGLTTLPDEFGQLSNLKELFLTYNHFTKLPFALSQLSQLERLRLDQSFSLDVLPNWIGQLSNLKELTLNGGWNLTSLPDSFSQLKNLEGLYLGYSSITSIDAVFELPKLRSLHLNALNKLNNIADKFNQLPDLQRFELDGCGNVKAVPDSLGLCKKLSYLKVGNQHFGTLPASLAELPANCVFWGTTWTCAPEARAKLLRDVEAVKQRNPALGPQVKEP